MKCVCINTLKCLKNRLVYQRSFLYKSRYLKHHAILKIGSNIVYRAELGGLTRLFKKNPTLLAVFVYKEAKREPLDEY